MVCFVHLFSLLNLSLGRKREVQVETCQPHKNTVCQCKEGYYKSIIDSAQFQCRACKKCAANENLMKPCEIRFYFILKFTNVQLFITSVLTKRSSSSQVMQTTTLCANVRRTFTGSRKTGPVSPARSEFYQCKWTGSAQIVASRPYGKVLF